MHRRELLSALAASTLVSAETADKSPAYLEVKTWRLHTTPEDQAARLHEYLKNGLAPALERAGAKLDGAFSNVIGVGGPFTVTLTEFASMAAMQQVLAKLSADDAHQAALRKLDSGPGLPFVRVDSSLLRSFSGMLAPVVSNTGTARVFELRTYESQTFVTLARKVGMFNGGEMQIFERLGFRPVFFGETIVGPRQPNLMYMLSYVDLGSRDRLWKTFINDPDWKKLSSQPELKDSQIVANISNVILAPLEFSPIR
jgi:hypothetical protein